MHWSQPPVTLTTFFNFAPLVGPQIFVTHFNQTQQKENKQKHIDSATPTLKETIITILNMQVAICQW